MSDALSDIQARRSIIGGLITTVGALLVESMPVSADQASKQQSSAKPKRTKIKVAKNAKETGTHPLLKDLDLKKFNPIMLDPTKGTYLCTIANGGSMIGRMDGQWAAAAGQPYWGVGGDPHTPYNGLPRYCCLYACFNESNQLVAPPAMSDPQDGWEVDNYYGALIYVVGVMNDDKTGKQVTNPANPMRCTLGV